MILKDYVQVLRRRWVTVCVAALLAALDALAFTLTTPPQYQASTQLFVSASSGSSIQDLYLTNQLSQERLQSYAELITSRTLAQRTVDNRNLGIAPDSLRAKVRASAQPNTVLIDVSVVDESPTRARDLANAVSDEFVTLAAEFDRPPDGSARPDARIVVNQRASLPSKPIAPNKRRNLLLGLAAGLALGAGLAVLREQTDNAINDRETIEAVTCVGLVGRIPSSPELRNGRVIAPAGNSSIASESFRSLRTNVRFLHVDNPPRVIVVTSALPGEGKSTVAINLAMALAETEHSVVLVDGDMRRPSIGKCLKLPGSGGLSTLLSRAAATSDVLQPANHPNLTVLTSGVCPPNPAELLGSRAARDVLNELRGRFEFVIVDSSPLLAVTDGALLTANADGALIVCRYGRTSREQMKRSVESLRVVGATVLGTVLTLGPNLRSKSGFPVTKSGFPVTARRRNRSVAASGPLG